jgi:hypothetical protein
VLVLYGPVLARLQKSHSCWKHVFLRASEFKSRMRGHISSLLPMRRRIKPPLPSSTNLFLDTHTSHLRLQKGRRFAEWRCARASPKALPVHRYGSVLSEFSTANRAFPKQKKEEKTCLALLARRRIKMAQGKSNDPARKFQAHFSSGSCVRVSSPPSEKVDSRTSIHSATSFCFCRVPLTLV